MKLVLNGHDERYTVEQSLMNLFPGELPVYEPILPGDESWAVITLREEDGCRVTVESKGQERVLDCDTVLLALGFLPTAEQAEPFRALTPVRVIGDSHSPRKILFAVEEAYEAVRKLS